MEFYRCKHCGNIIAFTKKQGPIPSCCGEEMQKLVAGESDGAAEKHVPVLKRSKNRRYLTVRVGSVDHPMADNHYIEWIAISTKYGNQRMVLHPGDKPVARFLLRKTDTVKEVYAYCNLHGLWRGK